MQKPQKRWMKSVIATARAERPKLPFERGYRRPDAAPKRSAVLVRTA